MENNIIKWEDSPLGIEEKNAKEQAIVDSENKLLIDNKIIELKLKIVNGTATQEDKENLALLK